MATLNELLKEVGLDPKKATWPCQGKTIVTHRSLEAIARAKEIEFQLPQIVESHPSEKLVVILVNGYVKVGEDEKGPKFKYEWSIGESTPYNTTNKYPYAMAEKRAKGRVILKLLGLHGEVYTEEDAEEFKAAKPKPTFNKQGDKFYAPRGDTDPGDFFGI